MRMKKMIIAGLMGLVGVMYAALPGAFAAKIDVNKVDITNSIGSGDSITIYGLKTSDTVNLYDSTGANINTTGTGKPAYSSTSSPAIATSGVLSISGLNLGSSAGYVRIGLIRSPDLEEQITKNFPAEPLSKSVSDTDIVVTNRVGSTDTVDVKNVLSTDVVKLYLNAPRSYVVSGNFEDSANLDAFKGTTGATVDSTQFVYGEDSLKVADPKTNALVQTVPNFKSNLHYLALVHVKADAAGAVTGGFVKFHDGTGSTAIGTGTTFTPAAGAAWSTQFAVVAGKDVTTGPLTLKIGTTSTTPIYVDGLRIIEIPQSLYESIVGSKVVNNVTQTIPKLFKNVPVAVGNATAQLELMYPFAAYMIKPSDRGGYLGSKTGGTSASFTNLNLGLTGTGVMVSVTKSGGKESVRMNFKPIITSDKTSKSIVLEPITKAPVQAQIKVINNLGATDTVEISGYAGLLSPTVTFYDKDLNNKSLSCQTVTTKNKIVCYKGSVSSSSLNLASDFPLDGTSRYLYVSFKETGKTESPYLKVTIPNEVKSKVLYTSQIVVKNNLNPTKDTITINKIGSTDVIKVYANKTDANPIADGTSTATSSGFTTLSIDFGKDTAGSLYVTRKTGTQAESDRILINFLAVPSK